MPQLLDSHPAPISGLTARSARNTNARLRRQTWDVRDPGRAGRPVRDLLRAHPALAARFPAVIDLPGYTAGQLAAIFATLGGAAGLSSPDAAREAAAALAQAEAGHRSGDARVAVPAPQPGHRQARRITTAPQPADPATLSTIDAADIPDHVHRHDPPADDWPGQYL